MLSYEGQLQALWKCFDPFVWVMVSSFCTEQFCEGVHEMDIFEHSSVSYFRSDRLSALFELFVSTLVIILVAPVVSVPVQIL